MRTGVGVTTGSTSEEPRQAGGDRPTVKRT